MTHLREILQQPSVVMVGWSLVHFLWQGVLVALVVAAVLRANRHSSAETRYAIAGTGLLVMLACPIVTFLVMSAGGHSYVSNPGDTTGFAQPVSASGGDAGPALLAPISVWNWVVELPYRFPAYRLLPLLVSVWAVGVSVLAIRLVLGWLQISFVRTTAFPVKNNVIRARLADLSRRMGIEYPVALLESALAPGPAVIGVLKPAILFPAAALTGLWPIQIEAILAHELAHVRRHDYLVNLLQSVVETLLFYHPAVWLVSKKIREEREHCCDDLAVQACGDRKFYATCLADLDELRPAQMALAMGAAGGTGILPRIRRILCLPGGENRAASAAAGILLVAATGTALMVLAGTPVAQGANQDLPVDGAASAPAGVVAVETHTSTASFEQAEPSTGRTSLATNQSATKEHADVARVETAIDVSPTQEVGVDETSRAEGYVPQGVRHSSRPYRTPALPPVNLRFPDLSMSEIVGGSWLPRLSPAASTPTQPRVAAPRQRSRDIETDFPPVSPPVGTSILRNTVNLPPPIVGGGARTAGPVSPPRVTAPRAVNYNGLLFVPDNFVLPQDPNYVIPQDNNYVTPQDRNYVIPQRNYIIPQQNNYVSPRGQAGGSASASGGRMSTSPSSGNSIRPAQNK